MRTPQSPTKGPDQDDLDQKYVETLQEEERFVYDEMNTGHVDAAESKGPDQDDLDQRYIETLQEEKENLHCKSSAREAWSSQGGSWASANVNRYEE